jgi:RNA polymerase sigma-70 factor, ECF subfamily
MGEIRCDGVGGLAEHAPADHAPADHGLADHGLVEHEHAAVEQAPEREVQRRLAAFARRFLRDRTEAEDVMQEALLRARHGLARLRSPERLEAWLFRICRHAAIDHRRSRRVREGVWLPLTEEQAALLVAPPHAPPTGAGLEAAHTLRTLPAHHRVLMSLHYERGLPQGTICQLTGLSTSALRVRLFRARGALSARTAAASGGTDDRRHGRRRRGDGRRTEGSEAQCAELKSPG